LKTQPWNIREGEGEFVSSYASAMDELSSFEKNTSLLVDGRHKLYEGSVSLDEGSLPVVLKAFANKQRGKTGMIISMVPKRPVLSERRFV